MRACSPHTAHLRRDRLPGLAPAAWSLHAALQYMASMAIVSVDSLTKTVETTFGVSQVPEPIPQTWESLIQETIVYVQSAFQGE